MREARSLRGRFLVGTAATIILILTGIPNPVETAQLVAPPAGAKGVSLSTALFQWTAVSNVQAYYLYVGTSVGGKDVVNTGETLQNSYTAKKLPEGRTLYARMWTKQSNSWNYSDTAFSTQVLRATLTSPANGSTGVPLSPAFQWTTVDGAEKYYLYVGTTQGANDVVNSGETLQTTWAASNLPDGQTLHARMWTKTSGTWYYVDSTFTTVSTTARVTSPANGAVVAAAPLTVQWNAVSGAQAYYLYVGTTSGAKDVVNTGEIQQTSVTSGTLPSDRTLYLRLWTKVGGIWRYSDSTVSTTGARARLIAPADGATVYPVGVIFSWGAVSGAQAYYLYVGTTQGATDVVNTGEIQSTSYGATLPENRTLYARLWTKRNNLWQYADTTLTTTSLAVRLTAPVDGAQSVPLQTVFQWTTASAAQAYYLYVGTSAGANDVVNTGEIQQTTYSASNLPQGQTLYARIWTKIAGIWRSSDSVFSTTSIVAQLTSPADGAVEVPLTATFTWTGMAGAEKYYLYVGTSPGLNDIVNTGELTGLSYTASLPEYQQLYARMQTLSDGVWRYSDSTFRTTRTKARFVYPTDKAIGVDLGRSIEWTPVAGADAYRLTVSTSPDVSGTLIDSGETTATTWPATGLPASGSLYARLRSRIDGTWRFTDVVFTAQTAPNPAVIVAPVDHSTAVAAGVPFQWSDVPVASGYRLRIGTAPGGSNVHDSGTVSVTRRLVEGMPAGVPLYGRISTRLGDAWVARDFTFTVANPSISTAQRIAFAEWASGEVRRMAAADNVPAVGSRLASVVSDLNYMTALCTDYAAALVAIVPELNVGLTVRRLDVGFLNLYEAHTLTELLDPDSGRWVILDPTFGLSARRASDGAMASAEDLQAGTVTLQWTAIVYVWQTAAADAYVRGYYIDYPLLFLNVFHSGESFSEPEDPAIGPYLETMNSSVIDDRNVYLLRCAAGTTSATVAIDGASTPVSCSALNRYSAAFYATTVEVAPGSGVTLYRLRRFVF